jgi:hypothetical protein
MASAPTTGTSDFYFVGDGPNHVMQGYPLYAMTWAGYLTGTSNFNRGTFNIVISNLPPYTAVRWPDFQDNGDLGASIKTTYTTDDTLSGQWSPTTSEFELVTNSGGTTTPGTYNVTVTATMNLSAGGNVTHTITWPVTVDAVPSFPSGTPSSYPAIPNLATWQSNMTTYGAYWAGRQSNMGCADPMGYQSIQFYDGERVYFQIHDYDAANRLTSNPAQWITAAQACESSYLTTWVTPSNGRISAFSMFSEGLYQSWLRTGDASASAGVHSISDNAAGHSLIASQTAYINTSFVRENTYWTDVNRFATKIGTDSKSVQIAQTVAQSLGHISQIVDTQNAAHVEPFMMGLLADSLIEYYNDGHQTDTRIPTAIKKLADYLWANAWNTPEEAGAFYYDSYRYSIGMMNDGLSGGNELRGLNLLVAPMYAWLYTMTGNSTYQTEGDTIFSQGVTAPVGSTIGWSGKNFSQNYRWSFDYVTWRSP